MTALHPLSGVEQDTRLFEGDLSRLGQIVQQEEEAPAILLPLDDLHRLGGVRQTGKGLQHAGVGQQLADVLPGECTPQMQHPTLAHPKLGQRGGTGIVVVGVILILSSIKAR